MYFTSSLLRYKKEKHQEHHFRMDFSRIINLMGRKDSAETRAKTLISKSNRRNYKNKIEQQKP